jgi:serine/threonine-protein kinase
MGAVYLAEHPFMGRKAAIKVLRREFAEDPGLVERFMNEARAANAIRHPNIIDIIDVGRMPSGIPYLMMELLEGESLAQRLQRGPMTVPEAVDVILQTTNALAAAHSKGIVHRDLKPDNLFLVPDDAAPGGRRIKVLDFGIAKLRGDMSGGSAKTQAGSLMGTPPYMSPEQCRGITEEIDHRTDIYAMGIILYEMLCGAPPFVSAGWGDVVLAHLTKPPPPPRSRNPGIPESLEVVIMKALAKTVADRFSTAAEMRTALRAMTQVGTFPPRQTAATMSALPSALVPQQKSTTFRTATGEMSSIQATLAESPGALRPKRKRGVLIAGVSAAAAIAGVVAGLAAFKDKRGTDVAAAPAVVPAVTAPVVSPLPPAAAKTPPRETPRPEATPAPPTQVLVRIGSEPSGALVTDAKRGVVIGATPFEQRLDRRPTTLGVRLAKDGFSNVDLEIPLGTDFEKTVRLERQKARPPSRASSASSAKKPVASGAATAAGAPAAAAPATAPPATQPSAPAAKPKSAEKW